MGSTLVKINFPGLFNDYAYYYLKSKYLEINSRAKGSGTPHVDPQILWNYILPIPPLPIQRAIVRKVESLFDSIDKGIQDLKRAQEQLKIYRQAVLKKAFDGDLTREWRIKHNLNIDDWQYPKLQDVLIINKDKHKPLKEEKHFYIGLEHIEKNIGKLSSKAKIEKITTVKNKFKEGQILYGKLRPYLNKVYLTKQDGVCSTDILVFSTSLTIKSKYAMFYLLNRSFVNEMSSNMSGVNLPRVSTKIINSHKIPLPSIDEQNEIIKLVESNIEVLEYKLKLIESTLDKSKALKQSILKKAFDGTLLNKDEIDACKNKVDYEPASILLKRINNGFSYD